MKFSDFDFSSEILKAVGDLGFSEPTEVQEKSFEPVMQGNDVVVQSKTGSGKTAAFGLPLIELLKDGKPGLRALILTPTRELAKQVYEDLVSYAKYTELKFAVVYGGVGMEPQIQAIAEADVVVGTPGRILDHLSQRTLQLDGIVFLVLDEADRMLDMGFIDDVREIIKHVPHDHITMMFSATMPTEIREIADRMMVSPINIKCESFVSDALLRQFYVSTENRFKLPVLKELMLREKPELAIVFCGTRGLTDAVTEYLAGEDVEAKAIHGGLTQAKREQTLKSFHAGKTHVLVATDVAARGLDIEGVTHIFNYNVPKMVQEYIHRMGRTARAGKEGKVITLLTRDEFEDFGRIDAHFPEKIEKYDLGDFQPRAVTMPRRGFGSGFRREGGGGFRDAGHERKHRREFGNQPPAHVQSDARKRRRRGGRGRSNSQERPSGQRSFYGTKN
jgi:ATP-dependent RNA helicase DeaD